MKAHPAATAALAAVAAGLVRAPVGRLQAGTMNRSPWGVDPAGGEWCQPDPEG